MILKRYGTALHSVELNFDSKALNEIGFRRDREFSISVEEWEAEWEKVEEHSFAGRHEGPVQDESEAEMLAVELDPERLYVEELMPRKIAMKISLLRIL